MFSSHQTAERVQGDWEYEQHLWKRYQKVYLLFGIIKLWTTTTAKCEVPVWAWTQRACSGFTEFVDEFCTENPERVKKYHNRRVDIIWAI